MANFAERLQKEAVKKLPEQEIFELDPKYIPEIVKTGIKEYTDPRPDLEEDSNLWLQLFIEADKSNEQLRKNLWEMRNWGTRIVRGKTQFVLKPDIDEDGIRAWPDMETYEKWRDRLLLPHKKQVGEILKKLFAWEDK